MPRNRRGSGPPPRVQEIVDELANHSFASIDEAQAWLHEHRHGYSAAAPAALISFGRSTG